MSDDTVLTPQEVADILKITKNTVYELIKREELNAYRVGKKVRVDMKDVEEYKNRTKTFASKPKTAPQPPVQPQVQTTPSGEIPYLENSFVICGQDMILDNLAQHLRSVPECTQQVLRAYEGSYNGLHALYMGKAQIATAHLWDGATNTYNIPYVRAMVPGTPALVIHLACRMQGFYVQKGNPLDITTWKDLAEKELTMINREKGSGTRILLDEHLKLLSVRGDTIQGYKRESMSHLAVATTVARKGADVGIGNEKSALQVADIDFIPLQRERYELVMKAEDLHTPPFQALLKIIRSDEFRFELESLGGYDTAELGKVIAEI
jgi:putative molybdopterin biosynthesis protein